MGSVKNESVMVKTKSEVPIKDEFYSNESNLDLNMEKNGYLLNSNLFYKKWIKIIIAIHARIYI